MAKQELLIGLDFGGTKLTAGIARKDETALLGRLQCPTQTPKGAKGDLRAMLGLADQLLDQNEGKLLAVGVSFGGPVDFRKGIVLISHHIPGWEGFPLRQRLQDRLKVPVVVDNDANAGAWGEWQYGAGQGYRSILYVTVSTGVGGGLVVDGRPYRGADSTAGEIGHVHIQSDGPICTCGRRGCVESLAAGPYIARAAQRKVRENPSSGKILLDLAEGSPDAITSELIAHAADLGDGLSQEVLRDAACALGRGIASAIHLLNPDCVILGGGVTKAGEVYLQVVREATKAEMPPNVTVNIVPATLGADAPLWGALYLAREAMRTAQV